MAGAVLALALLVGGVVAWMQRAPSADAPAADARGGAGGRPPGAAGGAERDRPRPVAVAQATQADVPVAIDALGTVTPLRTVVVRARVEGTLVDVAFREGQDVRAGDVIARIDARPFEAALAQAEGTRARDAALLDAARIDLARYRTLLEQDSIARQQVEAQASLVRQYEGALRADDGAIAQARLQVAYATVRAPISGRAGLRAIDVGNVARATDPNGLVTLTQQSPIAVVFAVPQDRLPAVLARVRADAKPAPVEAWDRERRTRLATGTLLAVDNVIDPTTGTVKLKAQFDNADGALFPNQFVNARLEVDVRRGATVLPSAAVQQGATGPFVYRVEDDTVHIRPVRVSPADAGRVFVDDGVQVGQQVVVEGTERLREGSKVRIAGADGADAAGGGTGRRKGRLDGAGAATAPGAPPSAADAASGPAAARPGASTGSDPPAR
ncbi:MAG: efflux RND transporter periplasmic adaptor subunit [Burkholderiales bacterium]|nr:efflux RND transporter periplasmic adaptor subunit [Burkholderiales bacterium]